LSDDVGLRDVEPEDLPVFFEHQRDAEAARTGNLRSREREAFDEHWADLLSDDDVDKLTITYDGQVAGHLVAFEHKDRRVVGYWLGRRLWGRGIATRALAQFLDLVPTRPLYAEVSKANIGSIRVLEKCGFTLHAEEDGDLIYELGA
jgi:RimJ/RimL family protein N-acetyltransferase